MASGEVCDNVGVVVHYLSVSHQTPIRPAQYWNHTCTHYLYVVRWWHHSNLWTDEIGRFQILFVEVFCYRPQTKFAKVMFLQVSVCPHGGACVVAPRGGHAWLLQGGHAWLLWGGMRGCSGGACVVTPGEACVVAQGGEHAWLLRGCVVALGDMRGCSRGHAWLLPGGHAWDTMRYRDMINERAVRILLECILVLLKCLIFCCFCLLTCLFVLLFTHVIVL